MNNFATFTEDGFLGLLRQLQAGGYRFARYGEAGDDPHVLWRHDVDFSMHRAARLAEIEAGEGAVATYFVNPRSQCYNLLEPVVAERLCRIRLHGHAIGLHFDAEAYGEKNWSRERISDALRRERLILELILGEAVHAVSWHNPDQSNLLDFQDEAIDGLVNAYGATLRRDYRYCSDSNGYWRFRPMAEVIAEAPPRLHLLTHPEWWTPEPMSPSARIDRAIFGRAQAVRRNYDMGLGLAGRLDVKD